MDMTKFNKDKHFEERLVQALIIDHQFAEQMVEFLDTEYFNVDYLKESANIIFNNYRDHQSFPSFGLFETITKSDIQNQLIRDQILQYIAKVKANPLNGDMGYVKDASLDFCKKRSLVLALEKSLDLIEDKRYEQVLHEIQEAIMKGSEKDIGHIYLEHLKRRMAEDVRNPIPTPWKEVNKYLKGGGVSGGELSVLCMPTGCHAKGTKILMHDGQTMDVEDIKVGDVLKGPDSMYRNVLKLVRGVGEMYKITPNKGKFFVVNDEHILHLKSTNEGKKCGTTGNEYVEITVKDYLEKSKSWKHLYKLYRVGVEFLSNKHVVHPYHMGLLLGDGSFRQGNIVLTSNDKEIIDEAYALADICNLRIYERGKEGTTTRDLFFRAIQNRNILKEEIKRLGLFDKLSKEKHIPDQYKIGSTEDRLHLLAGLMDTDGHYTNGVFDFCVASKFLAEDTAFVARSVGLCVTESDKFVNDVKYFRICISGDCSKIPTKLSRKKASPRKQKKNPLVTGFEIESVGEDQYYGFTVDYDNLYLLDDFTVMHNCGKTHGLVDIGSFAIQSGYSVVHYTLELNEIDVGNRYDSNLSGIAPENLRKNEKIVVESMKKVKGNLVIKSYPTKSASTLTIKNHLHKLAMRDIRPNLIIVDYGDLMRSTKSYKDKRFEEERCFEDLRGLGGEFNFPVWTATQTNRSGIDEDIITLKHVAECFAKAQISDLFITVNRKKDGYKPTLGKMFIAKSRVGPDGIIFPVLINTSLSRLDVRSPDDIDMQDPNMPGMPDAHTANLRKTFLAMKRNHN